MSIKNEQINFLDYRIYHPYWKWEDWLNGVYAKMARKEKVDLSQQVLSDSELFFCAMQEMAKEWKFACEHNLTNGNRNRLAFLGQSACSWNHKATTVETTIAWWALTKEQRDEANNTARKFVKLYEQKIHTAISL